MKNKTLLRTNLLVCIIILLGLTITAIISYRSNIDIYQEDVEKVSTLTSEGIYNQINDIFSQPVSVSLTMANDSLLKSFLTEEEKSFTDNVYLTEMQNYLNAYKEKYSYDSVFLVSTTSNRYYHFNGVDRVLTKDNPENEWYYNFLNSGEEYSLNVDNDEAKGNEITVFVNCRITDNSGKVMGVVGVGMRVDSLQELLHDYEEKYGVSACLINNTGKVEISSLQTGYENVNLFDEVEYSENKENILGNRDTKQTFWYSSENGKGFVVTRYEPNLKWHLIVESDTTKICKTLTFQLSGGIVLIIFIIFMVMFTIIYVIKKYNAKVIELTVSEELEYQRLLHETTEGLYENIFEFDITHDRVEQEHTRAYFKSLGLDRDASYAQAVYAIANLQIKDEYRQGYLDVFLAKHVTEAYKNGINNLNYDLMISDDGINYHWTRISARIFYWNSDKSIRMISYRKNIDDEKKREFMLLEGIQKDSMTGLYNKKASEEKITEMLKAAENTSDRYIFLILDVDNFKTVNDSKGHAFGDHVLTEFADELKVQFSEKDVVGRIGGDEFVVLLQNLYSEDELKAKLKRFCKRFSAKDFGENDSVHISSSVGVSLFPKDGKSYSTLYEKADQALYYAKGHGKNSFSIFGSNNDGYDFHINQRDIEILLNATTDYVAKLACTEPLKMLYFNEKCVEFIGVPAEILASPTYDALSQIYPEDLDKVREALENSKHDKSPFSVTCRFLHYDGHVFPVKMDGIYVNELYENKYPVLYALCFKV